MIIIQKKKKDKNVKQTKLNEIREWIETVATATVYNSGDDFFVWFKIIALPCAGHDNWQPRWRWPMMMTIKKNWSDREHVKMNRKKNPIPLKIAQTQTMPWIISTRIIKWTMSTNLVIDHDQNRFAVSLASSLFLLLIIIILSSLVTLTAAAAAAAATHVSLFITVIIYL